MQRISAGSEATFARVCVGARRCQSARRGVSEHSAKLPVTPEVWRSRPFYLCEPCCGVRSYVKKSTPPRGVGIWRSSTAQGLTTTLGAKTRPATTWSRQVCSGHDRATCRGGARRRACEAKPQIDTRKVQRGDKVYEMTVSPKNGVGEALGLFRHRGNWSARGPSGAVGAAPAPGPSSARGSIGIGRPTGGCQTQILDERGSRRPIVLLGLIL